MATTTSRASTITSRQMPWSPGRGIRGWAKTRTGQPEEFAELIALGSRPAGIARSRLKTEVGNSRIPTCPC